VPDREPIRFLFDYLSPYAYLAWTQMHALGERHGREIDPVPVLLAGLLEAHGHKGPAEIPPKRVYMFKHIVRLASRLGVTVSPPPSHPFKPLLALRVSSLPMSIETRRALVDRLYAATWRGGPGVEDASVVARIASEVGLDGDSAVAQAGGDEVKRRLRAQTEAAIAAGAFGVPTLLVDGELFWGVESLSDVERYLRGEDPVDAIDIARWLDVPATATRR
jgi:2-hydroxychromene-2-carboxylate isomerase